MAVKRKYIAVPHGAVQAICRELKLKRSSVYHALNYETNSENARQVRRLALTVYGGIEAQKVIF